jgi:hypothetical protein
VPLVGHQADFFSSVDNFIQLRESQRDVLEKEKQLKAADEILVQKDKAIAELHARLAEMSKGKET